MFNVGFLELIPCKIFSSLCLYHLNAAFSRVVMLSEKQMNVEALHRKFARVGKGISGQL